MIEENKIESLNKKIEDKMNELAEKEFKKEELSFKMVEREN